MWIRRNRGTFPRRTYGGDRAWLIILRWLLRRGGMILQCWLEPHRDCFVSSSSTSIPDTCICAVCLTEHPGSPRRRGGRGLRRLRPLLLASPTSAAALTAERGELGGRENSCGNTFLQSTSKTPLFASFSLRTACNKLIFQRSCPSYKRLLLWAASGAPGVRLEDV